MDELEVDASPGPEAEASEYMDMRGYDYAVVHIQRGPRGGMKTMVEGVLGFYFDAEERVKSVATVRGVFESPAILGPCGEVTLGEVVFADVDTYVAWARENQQ